MQDIQSDTIQEVDNQEPQPPKKLGVKEFAAKIKAKYPDYENVDDKVLAQKIVDKYPEYKDVVDFTEPPIKKKVGGAVIGANSGATPSNLETQSQLPETNKSGNKLGILGDIFSDLKRGAKAMSIQESGNVQEDNTPQPNKRVTTLSELMPMVNPDLLQQPKAQSVSTAVIMNPPTDAIAQKKLELDRTRREQLMQDAVINTAENALKIKGIKAPKGSPLWNEEVDKKKLAVITGNATYHMDIRTGKPMLDKTANWWDDIGRGWNKAVEDEDEASNFVNGMTTAQRAAYANERATKVQPDNPGEYLSVRHGVGELIGGAAPFMGKAIAGSIAGAGLAALAPETGGATLAGLPAVMSFAFTAPSAIKGGMRDEALNRYYQLKRENPTMSDVDAMSKAEEGMISGGISSGLLNAALSDVGGGALNKAVSNEGKSVLRDFIGGTLKAGHKLGTATALTTAGQSVETALEGYKTTPSDVIKKSIESYVEGAKTGTILHAFMTGAGMLPKAVNSALKYVLSTEVPQKEISTTLDANIKAGNITPEVKEKTITDLDNFKAALEKTNPNLSPESKVSVAGLMQSRDNLVAEMEKLDKTQQAPYQVKIDAINNQIQKITETNKPLDYELDDVTGEPLSKSTGEHGDTDTYIINGENVSKEDFQKSVSNKTPAEYEYNGEDENTKQSLIDLGGNYEKGTTALSFGEKAHDIPSAPIEKGTPEEISQPIELSTETKGNDVVGSGVGGDVKATAKALDKLPEEQGYEIEGMGNAYIKDVASKKLNDIIEQTNLPDNIKAVIRKRFSLNSKGQYSSSIPFDRIVKSGDIQLTKKFIKDVGAEILRDKYGENSIEYSGGVEKLNSGVDNYIQSLLDAEESGKPVKTNPEIAKVANILTDIQDKFNEADKNTPKTTAEAYHDAKSKGIENDFTKAVEQSLPTQEVKDKVVGSGVVNLENQNNTVNLQNGTDKGQNKGTGTLEKNTEQVRYNGTDAIGQRSRPESEKAASRKKAKEKISSPETNASLKAANDYNKSAGLPEIQTHEFKPSDKDAQTKIGETYQQLQDVTSPTYKETELERQIFDSYKSKHPELFEKYGIKSYKDLVEKSYAELAKEANAQFEALPIKVEFHEGDHNYESSAEMLDDVHNFGHLWVFKGGDDHTLLGSKTTDKNGITANDKFRAVHDYFGHSIEGYQFGKDGEENAWIEHSKMFSPLAQMALSSETRGQNSFVNYSGINDVALEKMKTAAALTKKGLSENNPEMIAAGKVLLNEANNEFQFAEQKSIVLPEKYTDAKKHFKEQFLPTQEVKQPLSKEQPTETSTPINPPIEEVKASILKAAENKKSVKGKNDAMEEEAAKYGDVGRDVLKEIQGTPDSKELTGVTHAETDAVAEELGLPTYEKNPETIEKWDSEANDRLNSDPKTISKLLTKLNNGDHPDAVEQRIMAKYLASLKAKININPTNELLSEYKKAKELSDIVGGREVAKSLVARKELVPVADNLADYMIREMEVEGVDELTNTQKDKVKKEFDDIQNANNDLANKVRELEEKNAKLEAEKKLKLTAKKQSGTKKTSEDYAKERESIAQAINEKIRLAREKANDPNSPTTKGIGGRTYLDDLHLIVPEVSKLVKSYVEEGISKLEDVVKAVHEKIKEIIPEITERDIHDIIAGKYNPKAKTKDEISRRVEELKLQAKLVNKLESLENGEEPTNERKKIERNQEIKTLREKIKDFEEKNPNSKNLAELKSKIQNEIKNLENDLATGNIAPKERKTPTMDNKELKAKYPQLYKDIIESKDKLIKLKQERRIRLLQQQYENRTKWQKFKDGSVEVLNMPRSIMSSMDFSAPLRQGLIPTISHPTVAASAAVEMFKQSVSQKRFDRWFHDLRETPQFTIMDKSGLYIADPHDIRLSVKEEAFMNNLAEKIPLVGKFIKGSERAYVCYLNKMRVDLFSRGADLLESQGKTLENSKREYEALASWVNNSTGRGKMADKLENAAPLLNGLLFSPRLIAARINTINPMYYAKMPKSIRVKALGDMAKFVGFGMTVLALAKLNGAQVETDPRSSDFGKIKVGNTRYDIWGGFSQYIRFFTQIVSGQRKSSNTGNIQELDNKGFFGAGRGTVLTSFVRGKLAPIPSMTYDFISGRTTTGDKASLSAEAENHLLPLIYSDVKDAFKEQGVKSLFTVGLPATFGVGVQTYTPNQSKSKSSFGKSFSKKQN